MIYGPNKLEMKLIVIVLIITSIITAYIFPKIVDYHEHSTTTSFILLFVIFFAVLQGLQMSVNYFYVRWQRK